MVQDVKNSLETDASWTTSDFSHLGSVEGDADQLMDDLFSDINNMLEDGTQSSHDSRQPEYVSLQSVVVPPMRLPIPPEAAEAVPESGEVKEKIPEQISVVRTTQSRVLLAPDKLLFAIACISFVAVVGWLFYEGRLAGIQAYLQGQGTGQNSKLLSASDAEFIEYMGRSLEAINSQEAPSESNLASAPVYPSMSSPSALPQPQTVLERVFIPVYPPNPNAPAPQGNESDASSQAQQSPPRETLQVPSSPQIPQVLVPPPRLSPPAPIPAPTPTPARAPTPTPPPAPTPTPAPTVPHTLVGLLELGDRSAALFNINGVTQRIHIGETIGTTEWTLVSVENQRAVIRRNGEVRSILVGQNL